MKHSVRSTLVALGLGVLAQRVLQLVSFLCIGRALGVDRLGEYAQGLALAAMLAVLAGTGVRNTLARAVARQPAAARPLVLAAVRIRFWLGSALAAVAIGLAFALSTTPWFWALCALQVWPAAFDLKNLLDATGRTRVEVALETSAALLQLVLVLAWLAAGGEDLHGLAAIALCSRCLYAAGAVPAIARLPRAAPVPGPGLGRRGAAAVSLGQLAHELMATGDVWLVAVWFGDATAGLYAVAIRLAAAALVPSTQLARLLLPHLLRADAAGDTARTFGTALRSTLFATLPMLAGGMAAAPALCSLFGAEFASAAPTLVVLLFAGCLQHLGWQCSHAQFAAGRDTAYAHGLWWPATLHFGLLLLLRALLPATGVPADDAATTALLAAGALLLGQTAYALAGLRSMRRRLAAPLQTCGGGPWWVASATGLAAGAPSLLTAGPLLLPLQLAAGGIAFATALYGFELRGRWRRLGDGLAAASGFRSDHA